MPFEFKNIDRKLVDGVKIHNCAKCDRSGRPLPVSGKGYQGILVVFDEPNAEQWKRRDWLAGGDSYVLNILQNKLNLSLNDDIWITAAMPCGRSNGSKSTYEVCSGSIFDAIRKLKPKLIITVGEQATGSVLRQYNPSHFKLNYTSSIYIGECIPLNKNKYGDFGCWLVPVQTNADIDAYNNDQMKKVALDWMYKHIERGIIKTGHLPNYDMNPPVEIEFDSDKIISGIEDAICSEYVAFDYETNCFHPELKDAKILTASMAFPVNGRIRTLAFPMSSVHVREAFARFLHSDVKKIGANISFEERWSSVFLKTPVVNWHWDVCIGGRVLNCMTGTANLKHLSFIYFGMIGYDDIIDEFMKGSNNGYNILHTAPKMELLKYNGYDSYFTLKCFYQQRKVLSF